MRTGLVAIAVDSHLRSSRRFNSAMQCHTASLRRSLSILDLPGRSAPSRRGALQLAKKLAGAMGGGTIRDDDDDDDEAPPPKPKPGTNSHILPPLKGHGAQICAQICAFPAVCTDLNVRLGPFCAAMPSAPPPAVPDKKKRRDSKEKRRDSEDASTSRRKSSDGGDADTSRCVRTASERRGGRGGMGGTGWGNERNGS